MGDKFTTSVIPHIRARSFVDEQVDQFDAFAMSWNGDDAIHLTFGRHSISVKNTRFVSEDGVSAAESGDIEAIRLDVAAVAMPLNVARELAATLSRMIAHADDRRSRGE